MRNRARLNRQHDTFFSPPPVGVKQDERESNARFMGEHLGPRSRIFVMPFRRAFDAKAIDAYLPDAEFYGTDWRRRAAENVDDVRPGKRIAMQWRTVRDYIDSNAGKLNFHGAFIDFNGELNAGYHQQIVDFAGLMMMDHAVLAVTAQAGGRPINALTDMVRSNLLSVRRSCTLLHANSYVSGKQPKPYNMANMVFLLDQNAKNHAV